MESFWGRYRENRLLTTVQETLEVSGRGSEGERVAEPRLGTRCSKSRQRRLIDRTLIDGASVSGPNGSRNWRDCMGTVVTTPAEYAPAPGGGSRRHFGASRQIQLWTGLGDITAASQTGQLHSRCRVCPWIWRTQNRQRRRIPD